MLFFELCLAKMNSNTSLLQKKIFYHNIFNTLKNSI